MSRRKKSPNHGVKPLEVVTHGHPALRSKGRRIETIDDSIRELAESMIATMYDKDGVGLAAHQVGRTLQMAVIDVMPAHDDRPSRAWVGGEEVALETLMPMILINPEIHPVGEDREIGMEGCLSMPGLHDEVERHARIRIIYQDLSGTTLEIEAEGLLSRAAQHEHDHLHGILFIDHLSTESRSLHQPLLRKFLKENSLG